MAGKITVEITADTRQFKAEVDGLGRKVKTALDPMATNINSLRSSVSGLSVGFAALGVAGVAALKQIGERALEAAKRIDATINTLKALTGSAQAAEQRFAALFALAQKTPGLTTSLATTLDTSLRILNVTEKTIDRLLPTIGKLNAIAPLGDPRRFAENLGQLVTQGFEKQDLRELVGNSPFAGEIIKSLFNVDSAINAKAIRESAGKLGIKTFEEFAIAFAKAAEEDTRLQAVTESIGTRFEKLQDRLDIALAGVGRELAKTLLPLFEDLVEAAERYGKVVAEVFSDNRSDIISTVRSVGDLITRLGDLTNAIFSLGSSAKSGLSGLKQEFEDIASFFAFLTDLSEGNIVSRPRTKALAQEQQAGRSSPFLESPVRKLPEVPLPNRRPPSPGGGGASDTISKAAKERAKELADARKNSAEALDELMKGNVEDLEQISKIINETNVIGENRRRQIEGRPAQLARFNAAQSERIRQIELESLRLEENTAKKAAEEAEKVNKKLEKAGELLSASERFARGFANATDTVGDAFERFGQNVANSFRNVKDLFSGLKQSVLSFFNDVLGSTLQNLVRGTLGPLFGAGGGGLGNLFRTPSFAGGGISAPPSVSGGGLGSFFSSIFGSGGGSSGNASSTFASGLPRSAPGFGDALLRGAGFGSAKPSFLGGIGQSLAAAAPFLGASLGGGLGGQSVAGQIAGSAGGFLAGGTITALAGGLGKAATAFFTNPFTIAIGAGLIVGSVLLGKAKQRKADEQASGEMLTQALNALTQLRDAIGADQIDGSQARSIFDSQILGQFKSGINTLKTKSVRESRLSNQVADLQKVYSDIIPPAIAAQEARKAAGIANQTRLQNNALRDSRIIPEFATGGTTMGGLALLHPGEKILNIQQQAAVRAMAGANVFERAGVPGVKQNPIFDTGGTMGRGGLPMVVEVDVQVVMGKNDQTRIFVTGGNTTEGRNLIVRQVNVARTNREL
jgi:hypothetical protein